ncbi:MAG TPA: hypothetical protein PLQ61_06885 [Bacteroidales bacterium]|nr:hypothetical protein [Petrotogaceae bacterium]HQJ20902.1 hypothetical protein [Bacteroidales bacterium]
MNILEETFEIILSDTELANILERNFKVTISRPEIIDVKVKENFNVILTNSNLIELKIKKENIGIDTINIGTQGVKGDKGDKGDTGASGALSSYSYITGEALGGHRAVIIDNNLAYYADCTNLSHINRPIGISNNASVEGGNVTVVFYGEMEEVSWNWDTDKPIFFNSEGELTQTEPTEGFSCIIGTPITATEIFVNKEEILIL